jgi:hypothetical protein
MTRRRNETPRCGCCDIAATTTPLIFCEACGEPTCATHVRRIGPEGAPEYVCVICHEERAGDPYIAPPSVLATGVVA